MEKEPQNTITVDDLMTLIASKEVRIYSLNKQLAQMSEQLAQCQKELETLKQHPMLKKQGK